jgi:arsenite methyltransferase
MAPESMASATHGPSAENLESISKYRAVAHRYDASTGPTRAIRMRCIDLLQLRAGDTVLDVGCGTGLSFEPLLRRIGRDGRLLAFEQSPEMHRQAETRAAELRAAGYRIELQHAHAETVRLPRPPDAALFHYVHDITRIPAAVNNLCGQFRPGTRIAIAGMKYFPWVLAPLNLLAWLKNRPYNVRAHEMNRPWNMIERHLESFDWHSTQCGMGYIGSGRVKEGEH